MGSSDTKLGSCQVWSPEGRAILTAIENLPEAPDEQEEQSPRTEVLAAADEQAEPATADTHAAPIGKRGELLTSTTGSFVVCMPGCFAASIRPAACDGRRFGPQLATHATVRSRWLA